MTTTSRPCMNEDEQCAGPILLREALSPTGVRHPRCEAHWEQRLEVEAGIAERYPVRAPQGWSPLDAGEVWEEDE